MGKALLISKQDLRYNIRKILEIAKETGSGNRQKPLQVIAVVKGNGYGLGLVKYSLFLIRNGVDFLAVSTIEEALRLRKAGITAKILMLSSTAIEEEVEALAENDIIITIGSAEDVAAANNVSRKLNKKIEAHLAIDTGFGRYGFVYDRKDEMVQALKELKNVSISGTFTHFSMAIFPKDQYSAEQFERFKDCVAALTENGIQTGMLHVCNSHAFLKYREMRLDAVRVGSAFLGRIAVPNNYGLRKIAYLKSNVTEIKVLPKGYNISYSNSYTTKSETRVAVIPCGYADGFNVSAGRDMFRNTDKLRYVVRDTKDCFKKQELYAEINGKKCRVLGRIGMYHVTCDISGKDVKVGDEALFEVRPFYVDSSVRREYR